MDLRWEHVRIESQKDLTATINTFTNMDFTIYVMSGTFFSKMVPQIFRG